MENEAKYSKAQILKSAKYSEYRDVLNTVLSDTEMYSADDINTAIKGFMERTVIETVNR